MSFKQRRLSTVAIVVSAVVLVVIGVQGFGIIATAQTGPQTQAPAPTPSRGPNGQAGPHSYNVPQPIASPGPAAAYGDFRLIPPGYDQPLTHTTSIEIDQSKWVNVSSANTIRASSSFKEPTYLPAGHTLRTLSGYGLSDNPAFVTIEYSGASFPILVVRRLILERPIDVYLYPSDGLSTVRTGSVKNLNAIFEEAKPGSIYQVPLSIQFVQNDILTIIEWRSNGPDSSAFQFQEMLKIAESLVE